MSSLAYCTRTILLDPDDLAAVKKHVEVAGSEEAGVRAFLAELQGELEGVRMQLDAQGFDVLAIKSEEAPALIATSLQTGKTSKVNLKKPANEKEATTGDLFGGASPTAPAEAARNWQAEGEAGFKAGKSRMAPADIWSGVPVKEGNKRADAWFKGWDRANLAAPVAGLPVKRLTPVSSDSAPAGDYRPGEDVEITQTKNGLRVGDQVDVPSRTIGLSIIEALWSRNTMGDKATDFARIVNAEGKKLVVIGSELRNNKTDVFTPAYTETDRDTFIYALMRGERVKTKAGIFSISDKGRLGWTVVEHFDGYKVESGPGPMEQWDKGFAAERAAEKAGLTVATQEAQVAPAPKEGNENGPAAGTGLREGSPAVSGTEQSGSAGEAAGQAGVPQPGGAERGGNAREPVGPDAGGNQQPVQGPSGPDAGQAAGTGSDSGDGGRTGNDRPDPAAVANNVEAEREIALPPNYQITDDDHIGEGGPKAKVAANLEALRLLKQLEAENRKATPSEQAVLVRYVGWGAFAQDMFQDAKPEWARERAELKSLLTPDEYDSARASVLNAHYTSADVINGMWAAVKHLGFTGGRALEPASGVGHFLGLMPGAMRDRIKWTATELDKVTGAIAQQLYQRADINVQGFETLNRPNGFYDLAISNVPFGSFNIRDQRYKGEYLIHDYFFIRSLDLVRPGGVVAFITSSGTMDKANDAARAEIMKRADLLGAIRLPGGKKGAFAGNAGTEVTTDIIFLRRKGDRIPAINNAWQNLKEIQTPDGPVRINEYFADRPEMMLGEMRLTGSMYRDNTPVLEGDATGIRTKILAAAQRMPEGAFVSADTAPVSEAKAIDPEASSKIKEGAFYLDGEKVMRKALGVGTDPGLSKIDQEKVRSLVLMRSAVSQLLDVNRDRSKDAVTRQRLATIYDGFVRKHGPINKEVVTVTNRLNKAGENIIIRRLPNMSAFRSDPDAYKVAAIENYDAENGTATKAALFSGDVVSDSPGADIINATDGIGWSLNAFGELNLTAVGDRLGKSKQQVIDELGDRIFLNPNGDRWEPAEQYLSGDVVEKLDDARAAVQSDPAYERNVAALEAVQPTPLTQEEITVPFGAAWVPASVYEQFLQEVIGTTGKAKVTMNPVTKQYGLSSVNFSISAQTQFGTSKVNVAEIVSHALAMKTPRVVEKIETPDGTKDFVNEEATREAQVKTQLVRKTFEGDIEAGQESWVWQDADRAELLAKIYNRKFNRLVPQKFDGSHLTFPGLATKITDGSGNVVPFSLRPHQKASVWRMVQNGNTLLDHVVGAGKTFTMIAGAMEMKRLGQVQRPMFVVPNHMLEQFSREFLQAYPNANILVAQKEEMTRANRKAFAAKIAAERWDGIVITHDAFGRLPLSQKVYVDFMKGEIAEIEQAIREMKALQNKKDPTVKQLEAMKKRAETRLKNLIATERKDDGVLFEEMGVDQVIVDEAHLFKNLAFYTQHTRVKGLSQAASQRAMDLFLKVRELEKTKPGRSAIFATGTPISNTMAEMFTMQRYLQLDDLVKLGIDRFDAWAATFGEIRTNMELSADGRTFRETSSFSRFRNLPELVALYSKMADTKTADMLNLPRPKLKGGKPIIVEAEPNAAEENYILSLVQRAESVRGKKAEKGGDNMLKVVSEGRKVALDYRLIDPDYDEINPRGKVAKMVDNVMRIWNAGNDDPVAKAQLIFSDMGVPFTEEAKPALKPEAAVLDQDGEEVVDDDNADEAEEVSADESEALRSRYNLYEEIRRQLVAKGILRQQIAFIHEAKDDSKKAALFEKVRRGEVRVLVGSTSKMGVGTNVQKRLKAMHHLDAPWKPAEVEQRDGRILRQGNMNPEIEIYRYITKRSFDSFMWQTLERKANFIAQIKAGARGVRIAEDIDSPLPEAAELKAAASGDPRIMRHAELTKEVRDLEAQFSSHVRTIGQARRDVMLRQEELAGLEKKLPKLTEDAARVPVTSGDNFKVELLVGPKGVFTKRAEAGAAVAAVLNEQAGMLGPSKRTVKVARFGTLDIVATLDMSRETPAVSLSVEGYSGRAVQFGLSTDRTPQLDAALMSRMESELADIAAIKSHVEYRIEQIRKELPKVEAAAADRPFARMDRLKEAKQELGELTKALSEAKSKKPDGPMVMGMADNQGRLPATSFVVTKQQLDAARAEVERVSQRILGRRVAVNTVDRLPAYMSADYIAAYDRGTQTIWVSMKAASDLAGNLGHEAMHALKNIGAINPDEWTALVAAARKWGYRKRLGAGREEIYRREYKDKWGLSEADLQEILDEEAVADMFGDYVSAREQVTPYVRRIIDRLKEWLAAMVEVMKGQGISARSVMRDAYRGRLVQRASGEEAGFMPADMQVAGQAEGLFPDEEGADGKPQLVLPGAERVPDKKLNQMRADAPLRPQRTQKDMDIGLFGDESKQGSLFMAADPVDSPAFKRWFGDSKVVDAEGRPMVVYHGTRHSFDVFDKEKQGRQRFYGPGFYFAEDPEVAGGMGRWQKMEDVEGAASFNQAGFAWQGAEFKLTRPLTDADTRKAMRRLDSNQAIADARSDMGIAQHRADLYLAAKQGPEELARVLARDPGFGLLELLRVDRERTTSANVMPVYLSIQNPASSIAEIGPEHDGLHIADKGYWIAFEPNQIKSVFNRGTFDPANLSILGMATPDGSAGGGGPAPKDAAIDAEAEAELEDIAGNINLRRLNTSDDIKEMLKDVAAKADGFIVERRGVVSNEQTAALAAELGMTAGELMGRETGTAFNAHQIFASRVLLLKSAERVKRLAREAKDSNSLSTLAEFQKAVVRHRAIQEQVAGMTAEAGRALQQFNMLAAKDSLRAMDALLNGVRSNKASRGAKMGGPNEEARELADMISSLDDPAQVGKFINDMRKATVWDMIREAWINGLLSGPRTHVANILSNTLTALWQVPETFIAEQIGRFHTGDKVQAGEAAARLIGLIEGTKEGMVAAAHQLRHGEPLDVISKTELIERKAIPGKVGEVVRIPGRLLEAEDQFFKAVSYRAEINTIAVRMAMKEGRRGASLAARIAELRAKPTQRMQAQAHQAALYQTFQNKLGPKGQWVMNLREAVPLGWLILPFIRTPANILKYAAERTPLGFAMKPVRDNLRGLNGTVARDTQIARMALGSSVMVAVVSMAIAGSITGGGPDDREEERMLRATGWQPYSVRIGDTYYSYQRLDPIALMVGVAADLVSLAEHASEAELSKMASLLVTAVSNNIKEKTWISGLVTFNEAFFSGDAWKLEAWGRRLGGSVVPAFVAQMAQTQDPYIREVRTMMDAIKNRIPGMSSGLMVKRDVFGEQIKREGALGPDIASPFFVSTVKDNPLAKEFLRIGYFPSMPDRVLAGHRLTAEQYDRYVEVSGKEATKNLRQIMAGERWQRLTDERREEKIREEFSDARKKARAVLRREWPDLKKKAVAQ
jgi:N12 class adenine-specific DNA methylase